MLTGKKDDRIGREINSLIEQVKEFARLPDSNYTMAAIITITAQITDLIRKKYFL